MTSVDAERCNARREIASGRRMGADDPAQRGHWVRGRGRLCAGVHGKHPMISWENTTRLLPEMSMPGQHGLEI
ncbi:hypothetical protein D3C80_1011820 [compost metagenome]